MSKSVGQLAEEFNHKNTKAKLRKSRITVLGLVLALLYTGHANRQFEAGFNQLQGELTHILKRYPRCLKL